MLYKCVMKKHIDEAVYDASEEIYRQLPDTMYYLR